MRMIVRELGIEGESFLAIGLDPAYLPIYKRLRNGYEPTEARWPSLSKFVLLESVGEQWQMNEKEIFDRYGPLWGERSEPTSPHRALSRALPLMRG